MDMKKFAERLKYIRLQRNVSVDELAEAIKVNRTTINRYEKPNKINSIKTDKLEAIAKYLNVSEDYLIGNSDNKYNKQFLDKLSEKQNIEINNVIYLAKDVFKEKNVTLDGKCITKEDMEYLIDSLEVMLEILKRKRK